MSIEWETAAWSAAVAELWDRFDETSADDAIDRMRALAAAYPGTDGRAAFELAPPLDGKFWNVDPPTVVAEFGRVCK